MQLISVKMFRTGKTDDEMKKLMIECCEKMEKLLQLIEENPQAYKESIRRHGQCNCLRFVQHVAQIIVCPLIMIIIFINAKNLIKKEKSKDYGISVEFARMHWHDFC